jgi:hypothetical protein
MCKWKLWMELEVNFSSGSLLSKCVQCVVNSASARRLVTVGAWIKLPIVHAILLYRNFLRNCDLYANIPRNIICALCLSGIFLIRLFSLQSFNEITPKNVFRPLSCVH